MAKSSGASYGFGRILDIILAIIPFTSLILGIFTRVKRKNILGAVLNFFLFPLFWLVDLITVVLNGKLTLLV